MYIETHPFEEFIPKGAKILIVGSFPPIKLTVQGLNSISGTNEIHYKNYFKSNKKTDKDIDFYYGSSENSFWDLMASAFDVEGRLDSTLRIRSFLEKNSIGITDIIQKCHRKTKDGGVGSLDSDLKIIEYRSVVNSIKENAIEQVYCTSSYVRDRLKRLIKKDDSNVLDNGEGLVALPSPSRSYYRSAWRDPEYSPSPGGDMKQYADEYRIKKYRELFQVGI